MQRHPDYTRDRIKQLIERIEKLIYAERIDITDLHVAGPVDRISYEAAQQLQGFAPAKPGDQFRPLWATFWFRASAQIPKQWRGSRVDLLWDSQSEATLWMEGKTTQGLNMTLGDRPDAVLIESAAGGESISFQVELACNTKFGANVPEGGGSMADAVISPFHLRRCQIAKFDPQAWKLYFDAYVLAALEAAMAKDDAAAEKSWQGLLLAELNRFANTILLDDRKTWSEAEAILAALYKHHNPQRTLELTAIGHAHIDTAWLWPLAETDRKCERTFTTATAYMEDYPEYRFACSQAYQYAVIQKRNSDLYHRIRAAVKKGQFIPVGGTWIEPDCNIPSGESLCRQFLYGQRFFEKEFGIRCKEFWNPDVFGYNGQLPQIMKLAGINRFLTQKLSWNRFNKPEHHTFTWRGIDGSEVITHFPPADTYNAFSWYGNQSDVHWLRVNASLFKDHDRAHEAIMLYGFGDGGGGPTKRMLEVLRRAKDLNGLPRTQQRTSDEFFTRLEKDVIDLPVLIGELYFEYHRGTYTSQAMVKKNNRLAEQLLHDVEFASVLAARDGKVPYPHAEIDELWKLLLLNQFHDILPGSSIGEVYSDSARQFEQIFDRGKALLHAAIGVDTEWLNTLGVPRTEIVATSAGFAAVKAMPYSFANATPMPNAASIRQARNQFVLENEHLSAEFHPSGHLSRLVFRSTGRAALAGEGNVFELYDDEPTNYDAWDIDPFHLETGKPIASAESAEIILSDPARVELRFTYKIGKASSMTQTVRLEAGARRLEFDCSVDWHESHRLLKVAFPVNAMAMNATYEMQFGTVERPTHFNTRFDLARFEVPMHRWFDLSEHGFGVAILNDCKYGGSTFDNVMRLSLLRSPKSPDPDADMGKHEFSFAIFPHANGWREAGVIAEAMRFNQPVIPCAPRSAPALITCDDPNLIVDTIKQAEDSAATVFRMYECHGSRGTARIRFGFPIASATLANTLEDTTSSLLLKDQMIELPYLPYQILTVIVS